MGTIVKNVGRVSIVPKGAWSSSVAYTRLDVVNSGGNSYIAVQDVPAGTALTNTTYWKLLTEGLGINKNLLINWYFVGGGSQLGDGIFPINRRGKTNYSAADYCVDRWRIRSNENAQYLLTSTGFRLNDGVLYQYVDSPNSLLGKTVTLSVMLNTGVYSATTTLSSSFPSDNTVIINKAIDNVGALRLRALSSGNFEVNITMTSGQTPVLKAIKLELGTEQTLAHQEGNGWVLNEIPDYQIELIRCKISTADPAADVYANKIIGYNVSNRNLLDNWYFIGGGSQNGDGIFPINQRGLTTYPGAGYSIDRWNSSNANGTVTITQDSIALSASSSGNAFLRQLVKKLPSNTVITVSALIRGSGSGVLRVDLEDGSDSIFNAQSYSNPGSAWTLISGSGILPDGVGIVTFRANASTAIEIAAMKCELGTEQTLAHQENGVWVPNEIPKYETELIKCKTSTADSTDIYANKTIGYNVSNKNLLDNWYFVGGSQLGDGIFPINQRDLATYSTEGTGVDRWLVRSGLSCTVSTTGLNLSASSSAGGVLYQYLNSPASLLGKQVCLSALIGDYLYSGTVTVPDSYPTSNTVILSVTIPNGYIRLRMLTNGKIEATINVSTSLSVAGVKAVKLEIGSYQTLAHREGNVWVLNEIPNWAEELIKCKASTADSTDVYANKTIGYNVSNRNLLDNWYFVGGGSQLGDGIFPINQQGKATYSSGYSIDRWSMTGSTLNLELRNGYIRIKKSAATGNPGFLQILPDNLDGRDVTISILYRTSAPTGTIRLLGFDTTIALPTSSNFNIFSTTAKLLKTSFGDFSDKVLFGLQFRANLDVDVLTEIGAIKIEFGTEQTLAHREGNGWVLNEIPDWAEEMAACQRYYFPIPSAFRINATYRSSSNIDFSFSTPVRMAGTISFTAPNAKLFATTGSNGAFEEQTGFSFSIPDNSTGNGLVVIRANKSGHGLLQATAIVLQPYTNAYLTTYSEEE